MCLEFVNTQLVPMLSDFVVSHNKSEHTIYMPDGGRIVYASASDAESVRRIEQINAAWTAADEAGLMSRDIFVRLAARARDERAVKRRHMYAGTPIWGWLKDEFEGRDDEERRIIHASTRENPYLPEDYIANLQSSCPARLARAYIEGHFVPPGGSVYAEFDDTIHVVDWTHRSNLPTVASIDWSPRVPHILIAQMLPDGTEVSGRRLSRLIPGHEFAGLVVCDEIVLDGSKLAITREVLLSELLRRGYALDHFVCDPAGNAAQSSTTVTDIRRAVEMLGIQPRMPRGSASRSIQAGIAHVQNMLMPMDRVPRIYFARDMCDRARTYATHVKGRASINAIMAYGYPEDDTSAVPVKDGVSDHFCDCLRYLCVVHFVADRLLSTVRHTA
jgi:hypothetical protein